MKSFNLLKNSFATRVFLMLSLVTASAGATDSGLGVVIGDPTGVSLRVGLEERHSLETAFAFSSGTYEGLHFHGTYLWDNARRIQLQKNALEMYYGLGLRVISINKGRYDGEVALGPRTPIGLLYKINNPNIEIFGEISATLDLSPRTDVDLDAGIGFRVRF